MHLKQWPMLKLWILYPLELFKLYVNIKCKSVHSSWILLVETHGHSLKTTILRVTMNFSSVDIHTYTHTHTHTHTHTYIYKLIFHKIKANIELLSKSDAFFKMIYYCWYSVYFKIINYICILCIPGLLQGPIKVPKPKAIKNNSDLFMFLKGH